MYIYLKPLKRQLIKVLFFSFITKSIGTEREGPAHVLSVPIVEMFYLCLFSCIFSLLMLNISNFNSI